MAIDLSIIVPTINEDAYIEKTLKSILRQSTHSRFEIIVCDGGSNDNTVSIARKYARVVFSPTLGIGPQLDFAARLARGKILVFLDADTLMPEDYLRRVYGSFSTDKDLWACGATFGYYRKKKHEIKLGNVRTSFTEYVFINFAMYLWYVFRDFFHFTEIPGCNFCIRKDIYLETEGFRRCAALPTDIALSFVVRELIKRKRKGRMKILKSIIVLTSSRRISLKRSTRLVKDYSRILAEATKTYSRS